MSDDRPHRPRRGRQPSPATVREIYRRVRDRFGPLDPPRRLDPLEELVVTVLSQNTSDVNRDRAYAAMRRRFPTWEALARADPFDLAEAKGAKSAKEERSEVTDHRVLPLRSLRLCEKLFCLLS